MKLSEAMLLGSIGTKQGFGPLSSTKDAKDKCGIGTALYAVNSEVNDFAIAHFTYVWPWTTNITNAPIPHYKGQNNVYNIIWWLNDVSKWTRPQIAAWIATIEPQEVIEESTSTHLASAHLPEVSKQEVELEVLT